MKNTHLVTLSLVGVLAATALNAQTIDLSGGVSGVSGSFFGINYQSNNFRGLGQRIDIQVLTGTRTSQYRFSFTEPYFRDTPMSLGLSVSAYPVLGVL